MSQNEQELPQATESPETALPPELPGLIDEARSMISRHNQQVHLAKMFVDRYENSVHFREAIDFLQRLRNQGLWI